jgi:hypothetical protein
VIGGGVPEEGPRFSNHLLRISNPFPLGNTLEREKFLTERQGQTGYWLEMLVLSAHHVAPPRQTWENRRAGVRSAARGQYNASRQ